MSVNGTPAEPAVTEMLGGLADQATIQDPAVASVLRAQLTAWAAARPGHELAGFGDQIEIVSVTEWQGFAFEGTTQLERRALVRRQEAQAPETADPSDPEVHDDVDVWHFDVALPNIHDPHAQVERLTGSEHIHECLNCDALSSITCEICEGLGLVPSQKGVAGARPQATANPMAGLNKAMGGKPTPGGGSLPSALTPPDPSRAMESYTKAVDGLVSGIFGKKP